MVSSSSLSPSLVSTYSITSLLRVLHRTFLGILISSLPDTSKIRKGRERLLNKCLLAERMDQILLLLGLLGWEANRGIYFSSHKGRKDYEIENHPAVAEVSGVLVGSVQCLRQ